MPRPLEYTICRKKPVVMGNSARDPYTNPADLRACTD